MKCSTCHEDNPTHAKFCIGCAAPFGRTTNGPHAYIPSHLAEKIRSGRHSLEGERRRISVLFADIESSTAIVTGRDPEDARVIIDSVVERMIDAVHDYEGIVNQIMGDGIMALFGAPLALENHAVCACLAALRMQEVMKLHAVETSPRLAAPLRIRVGVNSGEVLVRSIAGDLHMDYTAVGQTTYLAAKLEQNAPPGTVLVTAEVMDLVKGYVEGRPQEQRTIRGMSQPIEVYELVAATHARTRFQVAAERGLNQFIGREFETAQLDQAADLAESGQSQALGIVGNAGVGKTRLVWEFKRRLQTRGWTVLDSTSIVPGARSPYFPIVELLIALFQVDPGDGTDRAIEKVHRRMSSAAGESGPDLVPILALLDLPTRDAGWDSLDPVQRRVRTRDALMFVLLSEARRCPTIVAIEDLQWADSETIEFLDHLVVHLKDERLLLAFEYRPERGHELDRHERFQTLRVGPLAESSARAMFRTLVGKDPALASLERMVLSRVEGNPFFLEESIRMLGEVGVLSGGVGSYHLARPIESIAIPATVKDVLANRIARLTDSEREIVQIAAVIGKDVALPLLRRVAGLSDSDLSAILARLVHAELLYEVCAFPAPEYGFRHAFTHEVAYDSVLHTRRKQLHASLVDVLEALHEGRPREYIELLAHHAVRGEQWSRAVVYLQLAARRAFDRSAMRETVRYLEEALRVITYLPPALQSADQAIDLRLDLRNALLALGSVERVIGVLREAEALAATGDDLFRQCRVAVYVCGHYWLVGQHQAAVEAGERALSIAVPLGDNSLLVPTRQYVGGALHAMGRYSDAQEYFAANITAMESTPRYERFGMAGLPAVFSRAARAWSLMDQGQFDAAAVDAEEALDIAEHERHGFSVGSASFVLGNLCLARGELPKARAVLEKALTISQTEGHRLWGPPLGSTLAVVLAESGLIEAAVSRIDKSVPKPENPIMTTFTLLAVCEVYLRVGRLELAARHAERTLERARARGEQGWEASLLRLLGEIAERRDPPDIQVARAYYQSALQCAERLKMRPLAAHCHLSLAAMHARSGSPRQARSEFASARSIFEGLGTTFWLERAAARGANPYGGSDGRVGSPAIVRARGALHALNDPDRPIHARVPFPGYGTDTA